MGRFVLLGVVAIALLFGGSVLVLLSFTDEPRRAGGPVSPAGVPPAAAPEPLDLSGLPALSPDGAARGGAMPAQRSAFVQAPVTYEPAPAPPPPGSWEAVPVTAKAKSLGRVGAAVTGALASLKNDIRACFQADVAARQGSSAVTTTADTFTPDEAGQTVLHLQLELQQDAVRIADAPVETKGDAADETIACAQALLRGRTFKVPGARAGERQRLRYVLTP